MKQTGSAVPRALVAGIIVIAAAVGGFLAYRMKQPPATLTPSDPPVVDPSASPPSGDPAAKPAGRTTS